MNTLGINIKDLIENNIVVPVQVSVPANNIVQMSAGIAAAVALGIIVGNYIAKQI